MRLQGEMLAIVHRQDADEEIEEIEELISLVDEDDPEMQDYLEVQHDHIEGLASGQYRAKVPYYNPFDEVEDHNWPAESAWFDRFEWVRRQDALRRKQKRKLAWRHKP